MEQLVDTHAQNIENLRIKSLESAMREVHTQVINRPSPPLDASGDLGGERPIAFVRKRRASDGNGCGKVGAARRNG